jgi:hypothetical protein
VRELRIHLTKLLGEPPLPRPDCPVGGQFDPDWLRHLVSISGRRNHFPISKRSRHLDQRSFAAI